MWSLHFQGLPHASTEVFAKKSRDTVPAIIIKYNGYVRNRCFIDCSIISTFLIGSSEETLPEVVPIGPVEF